jgi:hypothetical protein
MTLRPIREVPNSQVLDAAKQFHAGYTHLMASLPGTGVLLPALHSACIAIELYLKSLSAIEIAIPDPAFPGAATIHAKSPATSHKFRELLNRAPKDFIDAIGTQAQTHTRLRTYKAFGDALDALEGLFMGSRYPYEPTSDISQVPTDVLDSILATLEVGIPNVGHRFERQ